ncbi:ComEC family competence protein [bacterium]|nr:ComEC family competence protein [bacterium]
MFRFLRERVYVQVFIALALGSALGHVKPLPLELLLGDALLIGLVLLLLGLLWWHWHGRSDWWAALPGFLLITAIGMVNVSIALVLPLTAGLRAYDGETATLTGRVISIPKYQRGHLRFLLAAEHAELDGAARDVTGTCYVYLKAEEPVELYYSDRVELTAGISEVLPPKNRGQFDYRRYLLIRGTVLTAYSRSPEQLRRLNPAPPLWAGLSRLRGWLTDGLAAGLPEDLGELAVSVVYGDKITDLPEEMEERFRRAGLTHILVASGTQVSLLIVLLALLCWRLPDDFTWRGLLLNLLQFAVTFGVVFIYAAVTGLETSILRALVMGVLVMAGRLAYRQVDGLTTLAQSGLILLVVSPLQLLAPGFQLSFIATFGLIYLAGVGFPLAAHLTGWRRWTAQTLITTGGAQLFVAPVLAAHFHQLSLWGLFSNLLAIPLSFALLAVGGLASLGLGSIPLIGPLITWVVWGLTWLLNGVATVFAALPGGNLAVPKPPWWAIAALYGAVFLAGEWLKLREPAGTATRRLVRLGVPALAGGLLIWLMAWLAVPAPELAVLNLPMSEGYIWRPYTGRSIAILRAKGLERQHNADTVQSALRVRGINRLSGIVWLDEPAPEMLPDYPAPLYRPGDAVPEDWDLAWLGGGDELCGARLALGESEAWVVWSEFDDKSLAEAQATKLIPRSHNENILIVVNERTYNKLPATLSETLSATPHRLILLTTTETKNTASSDATYNTGLTIKPCTPSSFSYFNRMRYCNGGEHPGLQVSDVAE